MSMLDRFRKTVDATGDTPARRRVSPKAIRRSLTAGAVILALVGAGLIAYPFATDLWAARIQNGLIRQLQGNEQAYAAGEIKTGDALTRLEIPKIGVDTIVVEGTTPNALHAGAGHYPESPLPGEAGNVAIAGHRTTYGKPFNDIDKLAPGDKIILTTPIGRHVYEVFARPSVVTPTDWSPIDDYPKKGSFLTLTSCHPEGSATYRIVVHSRLIKSTDIVASKDAA